MALQGKLGAVYVQTSAAPVAFVDEATTADAAKKRYTITNTAKRYWDKNTAVTVKKDAVVQTTGFTIEYAGGVVVFDTALTTEVITVSGSSLTVAQSGGFFNWSADMGADMSDITTFMSSGWKEFQSALKEWSGSAEAYWGDSSFFDKLGTEVVVVLYADSGAAKYRFEGFAIITGDGIEANVDDVVQEGIDFQGVGPLYYHEG
ncbi:MAG: hypothetical protein M0021_09825 [Clostridia bacterium]|nr:hypothetical protein [Clostridia bacterium]